MPIDSFLLRNENILASTRAFSEGILYATNLRVIRYQKGFSGEKMDSLYYSHINSSSYERRSYILLVALGIIIIIFGIIMLFESNSDYFLPSFLRSPYGTMGWLSIVLGFFMILFGIFYKPSWYQISALGLNENELKMWRTAGVDEEARIFARFVQDQIGTRDFRLRHRLHHRLRTLRKK